MTEMRGPPQAPPIPLEGVRSSILWLLTLGRSDGSTFILAGQICPSNMALVTYI